MKLGSYSSNIPSTVSFPEGQRALSMVSDRECLAGRANLAAYFFSTFPQALADAAGCIDSALASTLVQPHSLHSSCTFPRPFLYTLASSPGGPPPPPGRPVRRRSQRFEAFARSVRDVLFRGPTIGISFHFIARVHELGGDVLAD